MITCNILFSGIGAQEAALKRLGLDFKVIGISEIDKYAIQSYEAINGPTRNYGDITQIERLDYADLWTYSSPCVDFSTAGKQKGIYNADGSLTRSGLLKHVERLLETSVMLGNQPKYLLMENVKGLVSKKFKPDFLNWLDKLEQLGYNNYWQVLNAKDYGIPQNRERVFVVSIRKDVDTKGYKFPSPVPLEKRLKDMLEPCVDEKYYLSADKVEKFLQNGNTNPSGKGMNGNVCTGDICNTLTTNKGEGLKIKEVSNTIRCGGGSLDGKHTWDIVLEPLAYDEQNRYIRKDGCVGTLTTDGSSPKHNNRVIEPLCAASRGRNPENPSDRTAGIPTEQTLEINYTGCSNTLTSVQKDNYVIEPFIADDTQGFDGVRYYDNYLPTLRSERSGLKVVEPKVIQVGNIYTSKGQNGNVYNCEGVCPTILSGQGIKGNGIGSNNAPKIIQVAQIYPNSGNPQAGRVYNDNGISPAVDTCSGGNRMPKILEQFRVDDYDPFLDELEDEEYDGVFDLENRIDSEEVGYRIRKLTPRECWRLMAFTDLEFDCAKLSGVSDSRLYQQAGNSIVVDVLVAIFRELFND